MKISNRKILITICARGGSKGVKGKNIRLLNSKPLIAYTIEQALKWGKAQHVIVSTDSEEIASISKEYGAEVPFLRSKNLAHDTSPKLPVIRHAVFMCEKLFNETYDIIIDLQPTSPIRKIIDIDSAVEIFFKKKADTLFSVFPSLKNPYFNLVEIGKNKKVFLSKKLNIPVYRRQDAPIVYAMNGSIYIYKREYILNPNNNSPINDKSEIYIMDELSSVDLDTEIDFQFVEFLFKEKIFNFE